MENYSFKVVSDEEVDLIELAKSGDHDAADRLYRTYAPEIIGLIRHYVHGHDADTEDLLQDVFIKALNSLKSFRGDSSLKTWISRIARNACINFIQRRKSAAPLYEGQAGSAPDPAQAAIQAEESRNTLSIRELLTKARSILSPTEYDILVMVKVSGSKISTAAQTFGIAEGTVSHHLYEAFQKLRKYFGEG